MKQGMTLVELAAEVERQAAAKMDFVESTADLQVRPDRRDDGKWGPIKLHVTSETSELRNTSFDLNANAHEQLGSKIGIPKKYYDRMMVEAPHLLAENVNHWLQAEPTRRMVRTLDGIARAFLSDHYQRRDNFDLMKFMLPVLMEKAQSGIVPWRFESQSLTEDHLYLKLVHTNAASITTKRGVDDKVHAGIVISLEAAVVQMGKLTNDRGLKIQVMPQRLIIPVDLEFEANRILGSEYRVGTANNDINAIKTLQKFPGGITVNHYLTSTTAYFIKTSVGDGMKYFERSADTFSEDNDFDTTNAKFKAYGRYSFGWTD